MQQDPDLAPIAPPAWAPPAGAAPAHGPESSFGLAVPGLHAEPAGVSEPPLDARASIWLRLGAYFVDAGIATLGALVSAAALGGSAGGSPVTGLFGAWLVPWWLALRVAVPSRAGESPGKLLAGIRTVDASGLDIGLSRRLVRDGLFWLPYMLPLLGLIDACIAERHAMRSTRDQMSGTYVVRAHATPSGRRRRATFAVAAAFAFVLASSPLLKLHLSESRTVGNTRQGPAPGPRERARHDYVAACENRGRPVSGCLCLFEHLEEALGLAGVRDGMERSRRGLDPSREEQRADRAAQDACLGPPATRA